MGFVLLKSKQTQVRKWLKSLVSARESKDEWGLHPMVLKDIMMSCHYRTSLHYFSAVSGIWRSLICLAAGKRCPSFQEE